MSDDVIRRGRRPSPEKRQAIMSAALVAFAGRGVEATTTREIVDAAGTTERTMFKHFGSKEGLIHAVIDGALTKLLSEGAFTRINDPRPFTRVEFATWHREFLHERVESSRAAPENYAVIFRELLRHEGFRKSFASKWAELVFLPLAQHLGRMQEAGAVGRKQTAAELAGAFYSLSIGYLLTRFTLMPGLPWNETSEIQGVVDMFQALCGGGA